jgi:atypical dual specificity phosphatase
MSRSVTVAVAYIMSVTNLSWKEALKVVRAGRSVANPNLGFQRQLQEFETYKLLEVTNGVNFSAVELEFKMFFYVS